MLDYPLRGAKALRDAEGELEQLLREAQAFVLQHPTAAQSIYSALVAEGRRAAATPEGAALRTRLARSPLARRWREAWEISTLNALHSDAEGPYPASFLDLLFAAAASGRHSLHQVRDFPEQRQGSVEVGADDHQLPVPSACRANRGSGSAHDPRGGRRCPAAESDVVRVPTRWCAGPPGAESAR